MPVRFTNPLGFIPGAPVPQYGGLHRGLAGVRDQQRIDLMREQAAAQERARLEQEARLREQMAVSAAAKQRGYDIDLLKEDRARAKQRSDLEEQARQLEWDKKNEQARRVREAGAFRFMLPGEPPVSAPRPQQPQKPVTQPDKPREAPEVTAARETLQQFAPESFPAEEPQRPAAPELSPEQQRDVEDIVSTFEAKRESAKTDEEKAVWQQQIEASAPAYRGFAYKKTEAMKWLSAEAQKKLDRLAKKKRGGGKGRGLGFKEQFAVDRAIAARVDKAVAQTNIRQDVKALHQGRRSQEQVEQLISSENPVEQQFAIASAVKGFFGSRSSDKELNFINGASGIADKIIGNLKKAASQGNTDHYRKLLSEAAATMRHYLEREKSIIRGTVKRALQYDYIVQRYGSDEAIDSWINYSGTMTGGLTPEQTEAATAPKAEQDQEAALEELGF